MAILLSVMSPKTKCQRRKKWTQEVRERGIDLDNLFDMFWWLLQPKQPKQMTYGRTG